MKLPTNNKQKKCNTCIEWPNGKITCICHSCENYDKAVEIKKEIDKINKLTF